MTPGVSKTGTPNPHGIPWVSGHAILQTYPRYHMICWLVTYPVISISSKIYPMKHLQTWWLYTHLPLNPLVNHNFPKIGPIKMPWPVGCVDLNHVKNTQHFEATFQANGAPHLGHLRDSSADDPRLLRGPGDLPWALVDLHFVLWHPLLLHRDPTAPWCGNGCRLGCLPNGNNGGR